MYQRSVLAAALSIALVILGACSKEQEAPETAGEEHAAHTHEMASMAADTTQVYTCPHHPEVAEHKPGQCSCGMLLVLKDAPEGTKYVCPMHPEVSQDGPGRCPTCNMFLVARTPTKPAESSSTSSQ